MGVKRKALSLLIALAMVFTMAPMMTGAALAGDGSDNSKIDSVSLTIKAPKCGTVVTGNSFYDREYAPSSSGKTPKAPRDEIKRQSPQPEVTLPAGVNYRLFGGENYNYGLWYDYEHMVDMEMPAFEGTIKGGKFYYALIYLESVDWDYQFTEDCVAKVTGGTLQPVPFADNGYNFDPEENYGYVFIKVKAVHVPGKAVKENYVAPTATKAGSYDKVVYCSKCGDEISRTKVMIPPTGKKKASKKGIKGVLLTQMTAKGGKSLKIKWKEIQGAEGYDIFFSKCDHDGTKAKIKKVKTIKGNKTFSWTKAGLDKRTGYRAYVKAWVMKDGKKKYVRKGPLVHAFTSGSAAKYTNAKAVAVSKNKVSLKKGGTFKVSATVSKLIPGKRLMTEYHAPKVRFWSGNKKVATVSRSGKIKAKSKGACNIYAIAQNGAYATVKVTVK